MLTADKVLVTIGTPCCMSAVGGTETYNARVYGAPEFTAYAAFDAGLVDIDLQGGASLRLQWANGDRAGKLRRLRKSKACMAHSYARISASDSSRRSPPLPARLPLTSRP